MSIPIVGSRPLGRKAPLTEDEILNALAAASEALGGAADLYTQQTPPEELGRRLVEEFGDDPEMLGKIGAGQVAAAFMSLRGGTVPDFRTARDMVAIMGPILEALEKLTKRAAGLVG